MIRVVVAAQFSLSPPGTRALMVYENQEGSVSSRVVDVIRWTHASNGCVYLRAWCHLRREERTFRADRIKAWDAEAAPAQAASVQAVPLHAVPLRAAPPQAVPFPAVMPPPSFAPRKAASGGGLGKILGYAASAAIAVLVIKAISPSASDTSRPTTARSSAAIASSVMAAARATPAPTALPATRPAPRTLMPRDIRGEEFTRRTRISSVGLFRLYESADADKNGRISVGEIRVFQSRLYRTYKYRENDTALRPDQFLAAGGGDCEDWALAAAGMLRYWGLTAWLASYGPGSGTAHAVCLLQVSSTIDGVGGFTLEERVELHGTTLPAGFYVPIDYDLVGSLSNAVEEGWRLRDAWVPESVYGLAM